MELVIQIARLGEHLKEPAYDLTISPCTNKSRLIKRRLYKCNNLWLKNRGYCLVAFAHESRRPTVRLNTGAPGFESLISAQK
jgi:hypothetical protein